MSRRELPNHTATNFLARVREEVQTYLGRQGDPLDRGLTLRDLVDAGIAKLPAGWRPGGASVPLKPGTAIEDAAVSATAYEPDLTPPPTPTGFAVNAAISHVFIEHAAPAYTAGHGHQRTRVYGVTVKPGDPLPTFSQAVELGQFTGNVWAMPSNPSTTWRLWIKWESVDGVLSAAPAGGTNGLAATTGADVKLLLDALEGEITASQLHQTLGTRIDLIDDPASGLTKQVGDLRAVYGTTVSAAQSAASAAEAQAAAVAAEAAAILAQQGAETAKASAESAKTQAATSAANAGTAATQASSAATGAAGSAAQAQQSATTAATAANQAGTSANAAATSATSAASSATAAGSSATASETSRVAATSAAANAATSANAAATSASTATTKATEAGQSATSATTAANTATTKAAEASTSASRAATSETNASGAASTAATHASTAASAATQAGASASSAATAADTATAKATAAGQSATSASTAANTATTKAGEAATSASRAAASETSASGSASTAATYASTAANAANQAGSSANAAATSADVATAKATEAGQFASSATTSANTASTDAARAVASASSAAQSAEDANGHAIAAAQTVQTLQARAGNGGNMIDNSEFARDLSGWFLPSGGVYTSGRNQAGWFVGSGTAYIREAGASANPAAYTEAVADALHVVPGTRYQFSVYTGAHRCKVEAFIYWDNAAGGVVGNTPLAVNDEEKAGGTTLDGYKRLVSFGVAPAGAAKSRVIVRKTTTKSGQADSWAFFTRALFCAAGAQQTEPDAYAPGPLVASLQVESQVRAEQTGALLAQYTVKLDTHGYVSGFGLASEGTSTASSTFAVRADKFYIANPEGPGVAPSMPFIVRTTPTTINGVEVPAGVYMREAFIQNGTITNAKIANAAIDDAKIANLSAGKITAGSIGVGEHIQSTGTHTDGSPTWRISGEGAAIFNNAVVRGAVFASSGTFAGSLQAASGTFAGTVAAGGVEVGADVGPGAGHFGLSLSPDNYSDVFIRRSDGVRFFRVNQGGTNFIDFDSASGNLNIKSAGFSVLNGNATFSGSLSGASGTFSGTLSASKISVGPSANAVVFTDPIAPDVELRSLATGGISGYTGLSGSTYTEAYTYEVYQDGGTGTATGYRQVFVASRVTSDDVIFKVCDGGWPIARRLRSGQVRFLAQATGTVDHRLSIWYRHKYSWATVGTDWILVSGAEEPQSGYGGCATAGFLELWMPQDTEIQFSFGCYNNNGTPWSSDAGRMNIRDGNLLITAVNF